MGDKAYRVRELAAISGVTVRTLHHYDAIGLLSPARRASSGYRVYGETELLRLQQILIHREFGLPLEKIKALLDDPGFDTRAALREQRARLEAHAKRTAAMIAAVDAALARLEGEKTMKDESMFDGFDPSKYEAEAKARWGDTEAYRQSAARTKDYRDEDWARIKAETDALMRRIAALAVEGADPAGEAAMALAEEHRLQIERYYYACSREMHRNLGQMYMQDSRFSDNLDKYGDGVAAFLSAAIEANAAKAE